MGKRLKLLAAGTILMTLSVPAYAINDMGGLPQCAAGSMFRILAGTCVPYDPNHPDSGSGNARGSYSPGVTNNAPAPAAPAPGGGAPPAPAQQL